MTQKIIFKKKKMKILSKVHETEINFEVNHLSFQLFKINVWFNGIFNKFLWVWN